MYDARFDAVDERADAVEVGPLVALAKVQYTTTAERIMNVRASEKPAQMKGRYLPESISPRSTRRYLRTAPPRPTHR